MTRQGETLENPMTWERITFLKIALGTLAASCYDSSMSCQPVGSSPRTPTHAKRNVTRSFRAR